jgi:glycerol-3-phosphate acyltransferase PlsY
MFPVESDLPDDNLPLMTLLLAAVIAYLVGAIPTGLVVGRVVRGIDVREHGSGNIGATNVMRVLGRKLGSVVLFLDVLKGLVPVALLPPVFGFRPPASGAEMLIGAAAVLGHVFPVYLGFRGGKGVATALGVFLALAPVPMLLVLAVGLTVIGVTGYVSAGSLTGAVLIPIVLYFSRVDDSVVLVGALMALMVVVRHRANLVRIMAGKELRFWDTQDSEPGDDQPIPLAGSSRDEP